MRNLLSLGFLALAVVASAQTATMPGETGTIDGNTRGYYFTAPANFYITGVRVLTGNANTLQNFQIVRFNNGIPPQYPSSTNDFTSLALGFDLSASTYAPVSVAINAGDVIGIYGNTVAELGAEYGHNSYAEGAGNVTSIFGNSVDLYRSGMQYHLGATTSPGGVHDLWTEGGFGTNISRVEFTYSTQAVPEPASMAALGLGGLALLRRRRKSA